MSGKPQGQAGPRRRQGHDRPCLFHFPWKKGRDVGKAKEGAAVCLPDVAGSFLERPAWPHRLQASPQLPAGLPQAGEPVAPTTRPAIPPRAPIAFSPVTISDGTTGRYGLGPVSVLPDYQKRGIGSAVINRGLSLLKDLKGRGCRPGAKQSPPSACPVSY